MVNDGNLAGPESAIYILLEFNTVFRKSCVQNRRKHTLLTIAVTGHVLRRLDLSYMTHYRPLVRAYNITR